MKTINDLYAESQVRVAQLEVMNNNAVSALRRLVSGDLNASQFTFVDQPGGGVTWSFVEEPKKEQP